MSPPPRKSPGTALALIVATGLFAVLLLVVWSSREAVMDEAVDQSTAPETATATTVTEPERVAPAPTKLATSAQPGVVEIEDDGRTLWISPTAGAPLSLAYLPSGVQLVVSWRPAEFLAQASGRDAWQAIGPASAWIDAHWKSIFAVDWKEVEQVIVGVSVGESGELQPGLVVRFVGAIGPESLTETARAWPAVEHGDERYYRGAKLAYYFPARDKQLVVVAPTEPLVEIIDAQGASQVGRPLQLVVDATDQSRQLNVLTTPGFLWGDGRTILAGELSGAAPAIRWLCDDPWQPVIFSAQLGERLCLEMRQLAPVDKAPPQLARTWMDRLSQASERLHESKLASEAETLGLPHMVSLLAGLTRSDTEGRQVVLRSYLPPAALPSLILAVRQWLAEQAAASVSPQP